MFNNKLFSSPTIQVMQPSMALLYKTAKEKKQIKTPAATARVLGVSHQRLKNWEARGISKEGALKAQAIFGIDCNALLELNEIKNIEPSLNQYPTFESTAAVVVNDSVVQWQVDTWPFRTVSKEQWQSLSMQQRDLVESVASSYIQSVDPPSNIHMPAQEQAAKSA